MSDLISRQDAIGALLEKGQRSRRYKLGEIWELNFDEIREALATVPSADKLKPCPFCGREARLLVAPEQGVCVRCVECGAQTEWLNDAPLGLITEWKKCIKETAPEQAVKLWNRRAYDE